MRARTRRRVLAGVALIFGVAVAILAVAPKHRESASKTSTTTPKHHGSASKTSTTTSIARSGFRAMACAPVAGQTMTNAVSHNCGFADTTNTGVPAGTSLVGVPGDITAPKADGSTGQGWSWNGSWVTVAAGGALKNVRVAGHVNLAGDGATVEDSDITTSGANQFGVAAVGGNNMVVDHNTIHGSAASVGKACDNGVRDVYGNSENLTITNNNIYWCDSGLNNIPNGGLVQQNYIHDLALVVSGGHANGMQFEPGSGKLMTIKDNTIFNPISQTDDVILSNDGGGTETNRLIDHNLLAGGGYCFYGSGGPTLDASNITFTNNHFARIYYRSCGYYGPVTDWQPGHGAVWRANVWDDTGAAAHP